MNVFWPEESGWSASVSAAITADSGATGQNAALSSPSSAADHLTTALSHPRHSDSRETRTCPQSSLRQCVLLKSLGLFHCAMWNRWIAKCQGIDFPIIESFMKAIMNRRQGHVFRMSL